MGLPEGDELPDDASHKSLLKFIRKLARGLMELWSVVLGFGQDIEANHELMKDNISRLHIQAESAHARIAEESDLKREHGTVWGALRETLNGTDAARILEL